MGSAAALRTPRSHAARGRIPGLTTILPLYNEYSRYALRISRGGVPRDPVHAANLSQRGVRAPKALRHECEHEQDKVQSISLAIVDPLRKPVERFVFDLSCFTASSHVDSEALT